jgi:hypothetical protein
MAKKTVEKTDATIGVVDLRRGKIVVHVRGISPLVMNCMSEKAKQGFLLPPKKKNKAEKEATLKHKPFEEYRSSVYRFRNPEETLLGIPGAAFKGALRSACIDMPGATKAQVGRLTYVEEDMAPVWGVPELWSTMVRQAGMARTPDVRTRAIIRNWAARFTLSFAKPMLNWDELSKLLGAAGEIVGVGDGRPEKGALSYGRFELVEESDIEDIINGGGAAEQEAALEEPAFYDIETENLMVWYVGEENRREMEKREEKPKSKKSAA